MIDYGTINYLRQMGNTKIKTPYVIDFETMLKDTDFPRFMREMLALLSKVYEDPVDIEFTVNFTKNKRYKVNLLSPTG